MEIMWHQRLCGLCSIGDNHGRNIYFALALLGVLECFHEMPSAVIYCKETTFPPSLCNSKLREIFPDGGQKIPNGGERRPKNLIKSGGRDSKMKSKG